MKSVENFNALIIDDDQLGREWLKDLLAKHFSEVKVKALCKNGAEGIKAIVRWQPDIIFLDIEMPGMSGFEMLRRLPALQSEVIFITAHDQYAINAIRFSALDYLLKPVKPPMLIEAVGRAIEKIREKRFPAQYKSLLNNVDNANEEHLHNLAVPTFEGLLFVKLSHVIRCESDDKYTRVFMLGKKMVLASRTLATFEDLLKLSGFIRIHKSHLINTRHLKRYIRGEGGQVVMSDGTALPVARRKKNDLLQIVSQFQ
jgi:two-component system LytT family response regulator